MSVPVSIVWFRQDLRVKDNPALLSAVENGKIIPVFILDTTLSAASSLGAASAWWLHQSLMDLNKRLNGHLQFFTGEPKDILLALADKFAVNNVVWNRCYEPELMERDATIKSSLKEHGYRAASFNGSLLWEPMSIAKADGGPYKVFTPYYRKGCLRSTEPRYPYPSPDRITYADVDNLGVELSELGLMPTIDWFAQMEKEWTPGEEGASDRLSAFIHHAAKQYQDDRNIPSVPGTSRLSPHLHFGEISPNQIWYAIFDAYPAPQKQDIDVYLSELGWREFSYYLLFHFPQIITDNFNTKFDRFEWREDNADLRAWQRGQTGIPIVDAGMRELWQTGYMHNRVRMVVGSFLVKNLLQDWRKGEAWFWDTLVDADRASNTASWQWIAGSGADAAPYFRIFNPVLQGEKFDKQGEYVKQYCPELADVPLKYIHHPWDAPESILKQAGVILGKDYPHPIVDLKASRERALETFKKLKEQE